MMETKEKLVPKLRFSKFEDNWKVDKLNNLVRFLDNRRKPIKSAERAKMQGAYPYYGASGIIDYITDYIFDDELILLGEDGENIISRNLPLAFRVDGKCWVNNHAHVLKTNDNVDLNFLVEALEKVNYSIYNTGTAQPKLNKEVCKNIPVKLPSVVEQQKIASFLSAVDQKINQLQRKKELLQAYKKGMMQQLFSQKLKFKDEDGNDFPEWEEKKLGEITSLIKDGTHGTHRDVPNSDYYLLSAKNIIDGKLLITDSDRTISKDEFDKIYKNYSLKSGDILLSVVGTIGRVMVFKGQQNIAFQRSVAFFRFPDFNSKFISYLMDSNDFQNELDRKKVVSAQPGIYLGDLSKIKMLLPKSIEEQTKIATFLSALDAKIDTVSTAINQTQDFKKGLLQQMFV